MSEAKPTCNMWGDTHCGRPLLPHEIARTSGAHINRGGRGKNTWETLCQCVTCAAKDAQIRANCHPDQARWFERRRAADKSLREAANILGIDAVRYSSLEHLKAAAVKAEIERFDAVFPWTPSLDAGERPSTPEPSSDPRVADQKEGKGGTE